MKMSLTQGKYKQALQERKILYCIDSQYLYVYLKEKNGGGGISVVFQELGAKN